VATASGPATQSAVAALPVGVPTSFPDDPQSRPGDVLIVGTNHGPNAAGNAQVQIDRQVTPGGPTDLATQAANAAAAAVSTSTGKLAGVAAQLNAMGAAAAGATATSGNVVAVVNTILADLAVALPRLADFLTSLGKG